MQVLPGQAGKAQDGGSIQLPSQPPLGEVQEKDAGTDGRD